MNETKPPRIVVIGSGITGLSCAYRLLNLSKEKKFPIELLVLEAGDRVGGVIQSVMVNDCVLELGPDAIFTEKRATIDLCKELGLENDLIGTTPSFRHSFIVWKNKLEKVPEGFYLLAPSRIWPFLTTPLFSWRGKLRILLETLIPRKKKFEDETLDSFVRRRLGNEALVRMAQPMVGGIYSCDPQNLSLLSTFPKFLEWEFKYGSVILGLLKEMRKFKEKSFSGPRYTLFVSLKNGLETLIENLSRKLPQDSIRLKSEVREISLNHLQGKKFKIKGKDFEVEADALCCALSSAQSAKILKTLDQELSIELEKIRYGSGATINLIYKKEEIAHPLNGFGFVVPEIEQKIISGCTFSSVKFPGRAPLDKVVLRVFIGGKKVETLSDLSDQELANAARGDLENILGIKAKPISTVISHHKNALPQYGLGHKELVEKIRQKAANFKGLVLAGNAYSGTGIPDCIQSGADAAEDLFKSFFK
ncbi:MAG: protoporphyrinogen oxidase [Elusimicrobia bacterium RIFCSPLOWO2_02_FULL_39_32]|nr:MAG: protoporphyrinogen oxidase [Elusimicrobia bacterium GWA2_38_7]OGR80058.1 MAG: protoporphyrinogen oxidase [Elusimicrobia bacterium RIFCSPHIGHO2_02_FULL_39_36]OGR91146.1 MAG: protoporphyrinogen oxidase [Elusimicrobia bacterium RIFCSPLOWO2_02_FULL_39_32]OGS00114.1 MAG: protoporphyrinogen oxidase [Elusimicrobia bacterium RIFCSPLOWO2_12_FULL_39_28]